MRRLVWMYYLRNRDIVIPHLTVAHARQKLSQSFPLTRIADHYAERCLQCDKIYRFWIED